MKIRLLGFSIIMLLATQTFGQITIKQQHMPQAGDSLPYSTALSVSSVQPGNSGANVTWDFSQLSSNSEQYFEYKKSTDVPKYVLSFGFSALALKIADTLGQDQMSFQDVYQFYRSKSDQWETVGMGFQFGSFPVPQAAKYSNTDIVYEFPLTYNDQFTDDYALKVPLKMGFVTLGDYFQEGTRTTTVDGYGTISTPFSKDIECIRVKSVIEQYDSFAMTQTQTNFGFNSTRVEYKWLATSSRIPILELRGTIVNGNEMINQAIYLDSFNKKDDPQPKLIADFKWDHDEMLVGDTLTLTDLSTGTVENRMWSIQPISKWQTVSGTTITDSVLQVVFNESGKYSVGIIVSNDKETQTKNQTDIINVTDKIDFIGTIKTESNHFHPNPSNGVLYLKNKAQNGEVQVYNILGQKVYQTRLTENTIDLTKLKPGNYTILFQSEEGNFQQNIIIK